MWKIAVIEEIWLESDITNEILVVKFRFQKKGWVGNGTVDYPVVDKIKIFPQIFKLRNRRKIENLTLFMCK